MSASAAGGDYVGAGSYASHHRAAACVLACVSLLNEGRGETKGARANILHCCDHLDRHGL
eukprot:scaffold3118_cov377-Prasinococcus_capsulatus_cf.AAC.7